MIKRLNNGRIILIHGDCLHEMRRIKPNSIDLVFADLPYGTTQCKWDQVIDAVKFWKHLDRVCKLRASTHLMTGGYPFFQTANITNYRYRNYWNKKFGANFTQVKRQPFFVLEDIEVYYRATPTYNPIMQLRDVPIKSGKRAYARTHSGTTLVAEYDAAQKTYTEKYPNNIFNIPRQLGRVALHETEKPVELMKVILQTYTNPGDTVLDPTMGSGSMGVACIELNRRFIGIELKTHHFDTACARLESLC